jgi:hypothetical protein
VSGKVTTGHVASCIAFLEQQRRTITYVAKHLGDGEYGPWELFTFVAPDDTIHEDLPEAMEAALREHRVSQGSSDAED